MNDALHVVALPDQNDALSARGIGVSGTGSAQSFLPLLALLKCALPLLHEQARKQRRNDSQRDDDEKGHAPAEENLLVA